MNIAFLCRWGINDGLTVSTAMPHLQTLIGFQFVNSIIFITLENTVIAPDHVPVLTALSHPKIKWIPFLAAQYKSKFLNQITDFSRGCKELQQVVEDEKIELLIAHGAPAGAVADRALAGKYIPYFVSLFEPHAAYMLESGVWHKYGLKYRMQKHWEELQKKHAAGLMPVTKGYQHVLMKEGVPAEKIAVVPCAIDADAFKYDEQKRLELRKELSWENALIGIYVGKYGGLYYQDEAFEIYQRCFENIPDFRLLILSPQPQQEITQWLQKYNIDQGKVYVTSVPHHKVPDYLSASDFALATYKPGASKKYLSPVKVGEYWANGLPVLLTEGIGDESDIIKNEVGGALFNLQNEGSIDEAIQQIQAIIQEPTHRQEIPELTAKYRAMEKIREAYTYFFSKFSAS